MLLNFNNIFLPEWGLSDYITNNLHSYGNTGIVFHMSYPNYRFSILERLKANSVQRDNGCIEYAAGELSHKYGLVSITLNGHRKSVPAHRAMYMATNDCLDLPSNVYICHKCDNPPCINIDHLVAGSSKDNAQDCITRGRRPKSIKKHTRRRKLLTIEIAAIRSSTDLIRHIAEDYGISTGYVSKIRRGTALHD